MLKICASHLEMVYFVPLNGQCLHIASNHSNGKLKIEQNDATSPESLTYLSLTAFTIHYEDRKSGSLYIIICLKMREERDTIYRRILQYPK